MVDTVIAEFDPPDPGLDWKSGIRQRILAARRAVLRHPWARQAIESRTNRTPAVLGYMDSVAGLFRAGSFSADLTHHVMHALGNRIWGFSPELFSEPEPDTPQTLNPQALEAMAHEFAEKYPNILAIATAATEGDLSVSAVAVTSSSSSSSSSPLISCSTAPNGCPAGLELSQGSCGIAHEPARARA